MNSEFLQVAQKAVTEFDYRLVLDKLKHLVKDPRGAWSKIKTEADSIETLYKRYLIALVLAGELCYFIGNSLLSSNQGIALGFFGFFGRSALWLIILYVLAYVIKLMAGLFGGNTSVEDSFRLSAISALPSLLVLVLGIVPQNSPLSAVVFLIFLGASAFSSYLFWVGIPTMLNVSEEKRSPFFVSIVASVILLAIITDYLFRSSTV